MNLRRATREDMLFLFNLRNDPSVRQSSFNSGPVEIDEHKAWFEKMLGAKNALILIAEEGVEFIGQIRFDIDEGTKAEVSISILPGKTGKGLGTELLITGCNEAFKRGVREIVAHIRKENKISRKVFTKAGFEEKRSLEYKGCQAIEMVLCR